MTSPLKIEGLQLQQEDIQHPTMTVTNEGRDYIVFGKCDGELLSIEELKFHLESGIKPTAETLPNLFELKRVSELGSFLKISEQAVELLILNGATCKTETLNDVVQETNCSNKLVKMLIQAGAKPTKKTLKKAIQDSEPKIVKTILKSGVQPTLKAMNFAVQVTRWKKVEPFLLLGIKPDNETLKIAIKAPSWLDDKIKILSQIIKHGIVPT